MIAEPTKIQKMRHLFGQGRTLFSKFALNASGTVVGLMVQLLALPLQLHALGAEQFGVLVLFSSFVMAGSVVDAGIGPTTLRFVARSAARPKLLEQVLASSRTIVLMLALVLTVIGQVIGAIIIALRSDAAVANTDLRVLCLLITVGIALSMLTTVSINTLRGLRRYAYFAVCETSYRILQPVLLVVLALTTRDATYVLIGNCVGMAIFAGTLSILSTRAAGVPMRLTTNLRYFSRHMSKFSVWIWGQAVFGYLGSQADRFIVVGFMSLSALSMYSIALQLASTMGTIMGAAAGFLMPEAASRLREPDWLFTAYKRYTLLFASMAALAVCTIIPVAPWALHLWLGKTVAPQVIPFLLPLLWVASSTITSNPGTQLMNAMGFVRFGALIGTVNNLLLTVAMILGGWQFGAAGIVFTKLLALPLGFTARTLTTHYVFGIRRPLGVTFSIVWPVLVGAAVTLTFFYTPPNY